ncbi:enoyl-CoA hydratase [Qipengyuania sp.]
MITSNNQNFFAAAFSIAISAALFASAIIPGSPAVFA